MKKTLILICMIMMGMAFPALALDLDKRMLEDGSVPLAQYSSPDGMLRTVDPVHSVSLTEFVARHGAWTFLNGPAGTPHRAFGPAIKIPGYDRIHSDNVEQAAMSFIRSNAAIMGVEPDGLRLLRRTFNDSKWYVTYLQAHEGCDVIFSEVELRIFENGNVMMFGSDFFHGIEITTKPTADISEVLENAAEGLGEAKKNNSTLASQQPYVLPLRTSEGYEFKLVYKVKVETGGFARYTSYLDAHNGELIWRVNNAFSAVSSIDVKGGVKPKYSYDDEETMNFANLYIKIDGKEYTTDETGRIEAEINEETAYTASFAGPYAVITSSDRATASITDTLAPGENLELNWDESNSHRFERALFYHTNLVHNFVKVTDPNMEAMDIQIKVEIEYSGRSPNAMSMGDQIKFLAAENNQANLVETPAVLYHEYGHIVNTLFYIELGAQSAQGMANATCQEGTADLLSALILDDPDIGRGAFLNDPDKIIRSLKNDLVYPDDIEGDSHHNGQILGGAFWDLREAISLDYVRHLSHNAKYGLPDDPDDGVAFTEWFFETLIADDDDGDLSNGTPNMSEIAACFNRHGIGTNLLLYSSFEHEAYKDTRDTLNPYELEFSLGGMNSFGLSADSVALVYSTDNFKTVYTVYAEETGDGEYNCNIPAMKNGTVVSYYFRLWDPLGQNEVQLTSSEGFRPYTFLVGFEQVFADDFKSDKGWIFGSDEDDTQSGIWERNIPNLIDLSVLGIGVLQPGRDHSEDGEKCLVTGAGGNAMQFMNYMPIGRTTVVSPFLSVAGMNSPIIKYYFWFTKKSFMGTNDGLMLVDISGDGENWINVDTVDHDTEGWEHALVMVDNYFSPVASPEHVQLRFVVYNPFSGGQNEFPPICEGLVDDFEVLAAAQGISGIEDENPVSVGIDVIPNIFEDKTTINYNVTSSGFLGIDVFTPSGKLVRNLFEGIANPGYYSIHWDGTAQDGSPLPAGMYLISVKELSGLQIEKIIIR